ncbi:hypothetical protein [Azohydromonas sediminis]|uniref:hypothetical protein n=1 Tax=Azohydromonas sediminis TaxID=2259674 RepID=UPI000E65C64E|nr:hypothetical protein [Azohydromonas sediminis]
MSDRTPRRYASYTALLGDGDEVHLLPHGLYVALARGDAQGPSFAGRTMTLLDWHVALDADGLPLDVVGETTTPVTFDAAGRVDWKAPVPAGCGVGTAPAADTGSCGPTAAQRAALRQELFGGRWTPRERSPAHRS